MAIGAGRLFGLNIPANFNMPILAKNPQDFWRRFHISLSEWLRDVVFMPIYMNLMKLDFSVRTKHWRRTSVSSARCSVWGHGTGSKGTMLSAARCLARYFRCAQHASVVSQTQSGADYRVTKPGGYLPGRILTLASAAASLYIFSGMSPL